MRKGGKGERNSDMIMAYLEIEEIQDNYEVWAPYCYRGIMGFVDLVVETDSELSLFKFRKSASDMSEAIKGLKLEQKFFLLDRGSQSKTVRSYLVIADDERNRGLVLSKKKLLEGQPCEILFLNEKKERVESLFTLMEMVPRLFRAKGMRLEEGTLNEIMRRPNHEEVREAIMSLKDRPEVVTKKLVNRVVGYVREHGQPPEEVSSLGLLPEGRRMDVRQASPGKLEDEEKLKPKRWKD